MTYIRVMLYYFRIIGHVLHSKLLTFIKVHQVKMAPMKEYCARFWRQYFVHPFNKFKRH